ncbi:MAG: hypothetical protein KAR05_10865 [Candidatus Omnitrophica bacterium]|nr:hypothetical protein [Candidatus Omnitrophota bacterium]
MIGSRGEAVETEMWLTGFKDDGHLKKIDRQDYRRCWQSGCSNAAGEIRKA